MQSSPASGLALRKCEKLIRATLGNALLSSKEKKKKRFAYPKAVISVSYLRMSLDYLLWLLADIVYLDHRLRALIKKSEAWVCCRTIPCK